MHLNPSNAAQFLAEQKLLSFESVVDGDFLVVDQNSRNRNLKIIRRKSGGFFIKQIPQQTPEFMQSMQREAACYRLGNEGGKLGEFPSLTPRFYYFDPLRYILIIELLADSESVWEYHQRTGALPVEVGKLQGEKLGAYHATARVNGQTEGLEVFGRQVPWILSIHETNPLYLNQVSRGNAQLIRIVQQYPEFQSALSELKAQWNFSTLIHGDIKWENMMLRRAEGEAALELKVIDWEIADVGDECWDAGAVIQAYLTFWVFSLPLTSGMSLAEAAASSRYSAEDLKQALAAYWTGYSASRGLNQTSSLQKLLRSMRCAAARMIQTAYESIQSSTQISPYALCKLQVSMNILRDPRNAIADLMGL